VGIEGQTLARRDLRHFWCSLIVVGSLVRIEVGKCSRDGCWMRWTF
jgi:hypothetical protein